MRRGHRKSRNGCVECKRRHIKCDEKRPVCTNCRVSERECGYWTAGHPSSAGTSTASPSTASAGTIDSPLEVHAPLLTARPDLAYLPTNGFVADQASAQQDASVDMGHMELLVHFALDVPVPEIDEDLNATGTKLVLKVGLDAPYLMHEILAISARHLAVARPARSGFYLHQAVQLQTRAIGLFNSANLRVNEATCPQMLLFSSFLGRHVLTDTLANRGDLDLIRFVDRYVQYVQVHRGLRAIASDAWPLLIGSELQPLLSWGTKVGNMESQGSELEPLAALVSASPNLGPDAVEACRKAIHFLQVGLDETAGPEKSRLLHHQMAFNWSFMSPPPFTELLRQYRPEALAVLAHYAVLLHRARTLWQVGDSGAYLLRTVADYLGPEWAHWLAWPVAVIGAEVLS